MNLFIGILLISILACFTALAPIPMGAFALVMIAVTLIVQAK
jgi:hypothetical protein